MDRRKRRQTSDQTRAKYLALAADCRDCRKASEGHRGVQRFCSRHEPPNLPGAI